MQKFEDTTERIDNSPIAKKLNITTKEFLGMAVNAFLIIVLALSTYVTVNTSFNINWGKLCFTSIFVYLISNIIYSNSLNLGEAAVAKKKEYQETVKACIEAIDNLVANKYIEYIDKYCIEKQNQELEARRKTVLGAVFIPWDKYVNDYAQKSIKELRSMHREKINEQGEAELEGALLFNKEQIKALIKARRMKCHKFSPQQLTRPIDAKSEEFLEDISRLRRKIKTRKMVTAALMIIVAVNFTVSMVNDFSFATAVEGIVKLIPVAWSWVSGHFAGYNIASNNKMAYYKDKARYCLQANNWLNEKYGKPTTATQE